jgi:hypothetical protein
MKHLLFFISIALIMLTSCKKDEDKVVEVQLFQNHVDLKSSDSFQIQTVVPDATLVFSSNNEFVATVNPSGLVTASRIGEANIEVSNDQSKAILSVTVTPQSTLYDEPICDWSLVKSKVIEMEGDPDSETIEGIGYLVDNPSSPMKIYLFNELNKLVASSVLVDRSKGEELNTFINERYKRYTELLGLYYIDALTLDASTNVVYIEEFDEQYNMVVYYSAKNVEKFGFITTLKDSFKNAI